MTVIRVVSGASAEICAARTQGCERTAQVWLRWLWIKADHFWPRPRGSRAGLYLETVLGDT
jgi:hypothetical protein